jgi:protein tyrosine/serine phosphatase
LDDDSSIIDSLSEAVPWYHQLVVERNVICLAIGFNIPGSVFNEKKLKTALQFMISHGGPYLIHCFAGIDRTGFVAALLEALMGASIKEIFKDYLSAFSADYKNLNNLECHSKIKYFISQLAKMSHGEKITDKNIQIIAEQYLLNDIHLSQEEILKLKKILNS